jgi:hypothetical protein
MDLQDSRLGGKGGQAGGSAAGAPDKFTVFRIPYFHCNLNRYFIISTRGFPIDSANSAKSWKDRNKDGN